MMMTRTIKMITKKNFMKNKKYKILMLKMIIKNSIMTHTYI